MAAVAELMAAYDVVRMYADPAYWSSEIGQWIDLHGERVVVAWQTRRTTQMNAATDRLKTDITKAATVFSHDGCPITSAHVRNARVSARPGGTPEHPRYVLVKASPAQKIDLCIVSILAHEAASDCIAAGLATSPESLIFTA
jgi:hypothetical protein